MPEESGGGRNESNQGVRNPVRGGRGQSLQVVRAMIQTLV
jgi:hypothetical protein